MAIIDYLLIVVFFVALGVLLFFVVTSDNGLSGEGESPVSKVKAALVEDLTPKKAIPGERVVAYGIVFVLFAFFTAMAFLTQKATKIVY
ncbi:hypothetical protein ccbrp13_03480 [Ktedonobacteria bacterium brp13]|nr:hypothetical protein ccbrp13_03480 [Ktedonobacteria bacterium brp13]